MSGMFHWLTNVSIRPVMATFGLLDRATYDIDYYAARLLWVRITRSVRISSLVASGQ
jgi:hypothetical protein